MMYEKELELAVIAAKKAGSALLERGDINVDSSAGKDIKLSSDKLGEDIILDVLSASGLPVLSEESGLVGRDSNMYWIIDPLDGSMNYYKGLEGLSCVSIALWDGGKPVLGVVNRFECGEIFTGAAGCPAELNGTAIRPSGARDVSQAVLATGFPIKRDYSSDSLLRLVEQIRMFKKVRMLGAAAIMASFVACGRLDAYMEDDIMLWDIAASWAIAAAAGAAVYYQAREDYKCILRCFSTPELMEDFNAKSV